MMILGINSSLANAEVAILKDDKLIAETSEASPFSQAVSITALIESAIGNAGISLKDINMIACTVGPGSFTGIRIGLAAAKGLEIALNIPLIGITVFEAAALNHKGDACSILVDSRRGDFFCLDFDEHGSPAPAPRIIPAEMAASLATATFFADQEKGLAANVCRLAKTKYETGTAAPAVPMYIRAADVTVCKK